MRAREFLTEKGPVHKIHDYHKDNMHNTRTYPSQNMYHGSGYLHSRMLIAVAGAPDVPTPSTNWVGGDPMFNPYTEAEREMLDYAAKQVGDTSKREWGNKSGETTDTHKTSPVAKPKKNRYGV